MTRAGRALGRLLKTALALWAAGFAAICLWTFLWPVERPAPQGDVIICLGAGIDAQGVPGAASRDRAETCGALFAAGAAPVVVFTGGSAAPGAPSAARVMADLSGIPATSVRLEEAAFSTLQNALFSRDLYPADADLIVVSEAFHLPRAWLSFKAMGAGRITLHASSQVRRNARGDGPNWNILIRESVALWFNGARYVLWAAAGPLGVTDETRAALLH